MQLNSQFLLQGGDAAPDSQFQRIMNGLHLHSDSWECQGNIHLHDIEANHQSWSHNQAILMAARAARSIAQSSSCWWVSLNPQVRNSTLKPGSLCSCKVAATQRGRSTVCYRRWPHAALTYQFDGQGFRGPSYRITKQLCNLFNYDLALIFLAFSCGST